MESFTYRCACEQFRLGIHTCRKLFRILYHGFGILRIYGRGQRSMALYKYGIPAYRYDGVAPHYEQVVLQKNPQRLSRRDNLLRGVYYDDAYGFRIVYRNVGGKEYEKKFY